MSWMYLTVRIQNIYGIVNKYILMTNLIVIVNLDVFLLIKKKSTTKNYSPEHFIQKEKVV